MVFVYILGKVEPGREKEIIDAVKTARYVERICRTYGIFDICIEAEAETIEELDDFVFNVVRKTPGIKETVTLIAAKLFSKES